MYTDKKNSVNSPAGVIGFRLRKFFFLQYLITCFKTTRRFLKQICFSFCSSFSCCARKLAKCRHCTSSTMDACQCQSGSVSNSHQVSGFKGNFIEILLSVFLCASCRRSQYFLRFVEHICTHRYVQLLSVCRNGSTVPAVLVVEEIFDGATNGKLFTRPLMSS